MTATLDSMQALTAMQQGADLRGMYLWTLVDNFEWHEAFKHHFGLYACDMGSPDLKRIPRSDSVATVKAIHALVPGTIVEVMTEVDGLIASCHKPLCCEEVPSDALGEQKVQSGEEREEPLGGQNADVLVSEV